MAQAVRLEETRPLEVEVGVVVALNSLQHRNKAMARHFEVELRRPFEAPQEEAEARAEDEELACHNDSTLHLQKDRDYLTMCQLIASRHTIQRR